MPFCIFSAVERMTGSEGESRMGYDKTTVTVKLNFLRSYVRSQASSRLFNRQKTRVWLLRNVSVNHHELWFDIVLCTNSWKLGRKLGVSYMTEIQFLTLFEKRAFFFKHRFKYCHALAPNLNELTVHIVRFLLLLFITLRDLTFWTASSLRFGANMWQFLKLCVKKFARFSNNVCTLSSLRFGAYKCKYPSFILRSTFDSHEFGVSRIIERCHTLHNETFYFK